MTITVNGQIREIDDELSVVDLFRVLELPDSGIAIAVNGSVVLRKEHPTHFLAEDDVVEIIRAVAGG